MATKLLLRFALLLSLAAIVMSVKVGVDPSKPIEKAKDKAEDEAEEAEDEAEEAKDEDPTSGSAEEKDSGSKEENTEDSAEDKDDDDDDTDTESAETTTKAPKKGKTTKAPKKGKTTKAPKKDKTTKAPKEKPNIKAIEKLILSSTFKMVSNTMGDDFEAFIKAMGFSKIDQTTIRNSPLVDISFRKQGKNKYSMSVSGGFMFGSKTFTLGKEFTDTLFGGKQCQSTIRFEGNNKLIKDEKHTGFKCHHVFEFSREDLTMNLECKRKKATLEFEKK